MPPELKEQHCFYCGESLGRVERIGRERLTCGKQECEREARSQDREEAEDREERARADGFDRY